MVMVRSTQSHMRGVIDIAAADLWQSLIEHSGNPVRELESGLGVSQQRRHSCIVINQTPGARRTCGEKGRREEEC